MSFYIGTNKVKDIYLGTSKVKDIYLGTEKAFTDSAYDPSKWTTLWTGNHKMHYENDGNGTELTISGLTDSKPIKIKADLCVVVWMPGTQYGSSEMIYNGPVHSLTIDASSMNPNIPYSHEVSIPYYYNAEEIGFYYEGLVGIYASGNTIYSDYYLATFCGGGTCGIAYWVLKEVAQYEG